MDLLVLVLVVVFAVCSVNCGIHEFSTAEHQNGLQNQYLPPPNQYLPPSSPQDIEPPAGDPLPTTHTSVHKTIVKHVKIPYPVNKFVTVDRPIPVPVTRYYRVDRPYEIIKYVKKPYIVKVDRKVPVEVIKKIPVPQPVLKVESIIAEPQHIHLNEHHDHHDNHHDHHHEHHDHYSHHSHQSSPSLNIYVPQRAYSPPNNGFDPLNYLGPSLYLSSNSYHNQQHSSHHNIYLR